MQMIDVLKRLAELDKANPNRPEYTVAEAQNIPVNISESKQVDECGMMSDMPRPSTPASINMTAGSGEELGDLIRAIGNLTSGHSDHSEMKPLSTTPSLGIASTDGMDMKSMIDKLNDIDSDEEKLDDETNNDPAYEQQPQPTDQQDRGKMAGLAHAAGGVAGSVLGAAAGKALGIGAVPGAFVGQKLATRETYGNTPADPTDLNEFDPEDRAHHENPPGAAKNRGLKNNPVAVPTMEQIENNLMHEYLKFLNNNQ